MAFEAVPTISREPTATGERVRRAWTMRHWIAFVPILLALQPCPGHGQSGGAKGSSGSPVAGSQPVIACPSLANLRAVLRITDKATAAVAIITDPRSDLGCSVLDRNAVTGIADQVTLHDKAYECLALRGTRVCQWTVAGSARPLPTSEKPQPQKPTEKSRP